jgi:uncharacterized delta-60 repeat protein
MNQQRKRPRTILRLEALEDRCLMSAGALDTTFNPSGSPPGVVTTSFGGSAQANAVVVQLDGKIVAAGDVGAGAGIARYNHDGSLDTSFNGTGEALLNFGPNNSPSTADGLALQSDGKIVVGGWSLGDFALARFTAAGKLDSTFGSKGKVSTAFPNAESASANAVAIQSDGKIVLAGYVVSTGDDIALARYETDGHLDDGKKNDITPNDHFGSGGMVVTSHTLVAGASAIIATDMAIDSAGRLVVVGYASTVGDEPLVARYNADGSLDTRLGGTGIIGLSQFRFNWQGTSVALQTDGKIVLTWYNDVIRLNANGSLDTASFGPVNPDGTHTGYEVLPQYVGGRAVQLQGDGKIVVAGVDSLATSGFRVTRLLSDGSLDPSFGTGGTSNPPNQYHASALAIQPDGCIIVAGSIPNGDGFALARFLPAAPQIGSFTASPNAVTAGSSVTLTAANVVALNPGSTVTQVAFYRDSNGDGILEPSTDTFLGYGVQTSPGVWTLTFSTAGLTSGTYTLFAQAKDSYGVLGDPLALTETVS